MALADAAANGKRLEKMGENAWKLGKTRFDRKALAREFVTWLEKTGGNH
jgi:hypothetical protein